MTTRRIRGARKRRRAIRLVENVEKGQSIGLAGSHLANAGFSEAAHSRQRPLHFANRQSASNPIVLAIANCGSSAPA